MREHCRHFTGIQNETCRAGIKYMDARDCTTAGCVSWME